MSATSVTYAEPEEVAAIIRDSSKNAEKDYVIVDVRQADYTDKCLPGSINVPADKIYDRANQLIETYKDVPVIYFHCALSQVRGPKRARIYNEIKNSLGIEESQKVKVLRNGFEGWEEKYREGNEDLFEKIEPDF